MAYYDVNKIIKLTRSAKGINQEELCEGICTTVTLSSCENGKHPVRRNNYKRLLERMGRTPEIQYAVCMNRDGGLLEDRIEMERAFKRYDYVAAEKYVRRMKEEADSNVYTVQYLTRAEALVDYYQKRIDGEELLRRLDKAIRMTVPEYEEYVGRTERIFPFLKEELQILMSIGNTYRILGKYENSVKLYETVLRCLEKKYIGEPDRSKLQVMVHRNMALVYEKKKENEDALQEIIYCLGVVNQKDYGYMLPILLSGKVYNVVKLAQKEGREVSMLDEIKKNLRQAYYIAAARGDELVEKNIVSYYEKIFGKWD